MFKPLTLGAARGVIDRQVSLDQFTANGVSVKMQDVYADGEITRTMGEPHREAFVNSARGRAALQNLGMPPSFIAAIFEAWGDTPTVFEPELETEEAEEGEDVGSD